MKYERIVSELTQTPWAITQAKLETMIGVLESRSRGVVMSADLKAELDAIKAERAERGGSRQGVAVIPLHGTISHRPSLMTSGGASAEEFTHAFQAAVNDSSVASIILDVDSPGGSVFGLDEASETVFQSRGTKPVIAVANAQAHSAAYQIASQADEFVVTPSGMAGSIGVIMAHVDDTKADEQAGYEVTYIYAGEHKAEGWQGTLTDDAREHLQSIADAYYEVFVEHVARGRGVTTETVLSDFGQGRSFTSKELLKRGMVDRIATFDQVVSEQIGKLQQDSRRRTMERYRHRA